MAHYGSNFSWKDFASFSSDEVLKPKLQLYARSKNLPDPKYKTIKIRRKTLFKSKVYAFNSCYEGGEYSTKEDTERSAANVALMCVGVIPLPPKDLTPHFKELQTICEEMIKHAMELEEQLRMLMKIRKVEDVLEDTCQELLRNIIEDRETVKGILKTVKAKIRKLGE